MADRWSGPVGRLGVETSDGRIIEREGFYNRSLPLPMDWQEYTEDGHEKAVTVATIDDIQILDDGTIWAAGDWLDEQVIPKVAPARLLVAQGVVYPSVEAAGCEVDYKMLGGGAGAYVDGAFEEDEPYRDVMVYTNFEMAKVTLVSVQAVPGLRIMDGEQQPTGVSGSSMTAAGVRSSGWSALPVAPVDAAWDGTGAAKRIAAWAGVDSADATAADWAKYAKGFLWQDPDADPMTKGAYKLGVADIVDGELRLIPRGVYAVAGVLNGARGGASIPQADQDRLKKTVSGLYTKIAKAAGDDTITAPFALVASGMDFRLPPRGWFDEPAEFGPITISPEGRVAGFLAPWDVPHIGLPGKVFAPRSPSSYAYFHTGATMTDGGEVATGKITVGGGHADGHYGYAATVDHYDNVGTAVATVRAGENQFGIWVAGAIVADATSGQVEALRQSPLSGDWREIGGALELVAAHAVNTPGFPVPRARTVVASSGRQVSLVASAMVAPPVARLDERTYVEDLAAQLAARLRPATQYAVMPAGFDTRAEDLRGEFARHGVAWPTISLAVDGRDLEPYQVAEGCVRGLLAQLDVLPEEVVTYDAQAGALALAEAKLRFAGLRKRSA